METIDLPDPPRQGTPVPGPPTSAPAARPAPWPFVVIRRGETTVEQLLGEMIRLDRQSPSGDAYPVLVDFPRCRHTALYAVPRQALTGVTYHERQIGFWSRGCPACGPTVVPPPVPSDPFLDGAQAGMQGIMARLGGIGAEGEVAS